MYKHLYQKFSEGHSGNIHFAAHSHHFWPDISLEAVTQSWLDSAKYSDQKWSHTLGKVLSETQSIIGTMLNLKSPEQLAFAPNTHELVSRIFSCFLEQEKVKVLTTKSEFHSFKRQMNRLKELPHFEFIILDDEIEDFEKSFLNSITDDLDIIFISHVFYNSGKIISNELIENIIKIKKKETVFCLDAYHGFCAIPTDLSKFEGDIFYLAGGYKYAQAGEGMCFLTIPKDCNLRPLNTGWFASFETLESESEEVSYSDNGFRFWGATQDLTSLYRFNFVWNQFSKMSLNITKIHSYIKSLQVQFIKDLSISNNLLETDLNKVGHFLTLKCENHNHAKKINLWLKDQGFLTDFRADRLRFGFGLYLSLEDVNQLKLLLNQNYLQLFPHNTKVF